MTAETPAKSGIGRPPERIRVRLSKKIRANGEVEMLDEDQVWPKGWPLPEQGSIVIGEVLGGLVDHVEFHLPSERVIVVLR